MNIRGRVWCNYREQPYNMRVFVLFAALFVALCLACGATNKVQAATSVPLKMNFQGRLTNSSGNVLADGTYNMRLRIYSAATNGTALWSEDRLVSSSTGVAVQNGLFSIRLGDITSLPPALFNNQTYPTLYLEVELPTPATATSNSPSWSEGAMTPRNQLATSAYAFNSDNLDGLDSADFAQVGSTNTFSGTKNTFKNSSNSTSSFAIQDSAGVNLLQADTTNDRIIIGETTADSNATFLAVDTYNGGSADPSGGSNGSIYYNSNLGKLRCYENGSWKNCVTVAGSDQATVKLTSDVSNSNATANTLQDTGLSFAAAANTTYRFTTFIIYDSAATTTGSRWTVTGPSANTINIRSTYALTSTTDTTNYVNAYGAPSASNATSLSTGNIAILNGRITTSSAGTVKIQFASEVASSAITAKTGSSMTYSIEQ